MKEIINQQLCLSVTMDSNLERIFVYSGEKAGLWLRGKIKRVDSGNGNTR